MKGVLHPDIANELLDMAKKDQEMRVKAQKDTQVWSNDLDESNTKQLKLIVKKIGWPTISKVGVDASQAAWLLVQHAYAEPEFMRECFALIKNVKQDDINPANAAFLEDRLLTIEDKPQIYGTQFRNIGNGWEPFPIKNPNFVDGRRASVGLGTLAENAERIRSMYS